MSFAAKKSLYCQARSAEEYIVYNENNLFYYFYLFSRILGGGVDSGGDAREGGVWIKLEKWGTNFL